MFISGSNDQFFHKIEVIMKIFDLNFIFKNRSKFNFSIRKWLKNLNIRFENFFQNLKCRISILFIKFSSFEIEITKSPQNLLNFE